MNNYKWFVWPLVVLLTLVTLAGCSLGVQKSGMANPASEYCAEQGGKVEIRKDAQGNEYGMCLFDDGSQCEEWAFYRGDCKKGEFPQSSGMANPASQYCLDHGGKLEIRKAEDGGEVGICKFSDGSECDQWAFFRGECAPGN